MSDDRNEERKHNALENGIGWFRRQPKPTQVLIPAAVAGVFLFMMCCGCGSLCWIGGFIGGGVDKSDPEYERGYSEGEDAAGNLIDSMEYLDKQEVLENYRDAMKFADLAIDSAIRENGRGDPDVIRATGYRDGLKAKMTKHGY